MSQPQQKIYVPRSIVREKVFPNGGSILTLGVHAEEMSAFLKQHANPKGWVNLVISSNRQVGTHGQTHSLALDTFEPNKDRGADGSSAVLAKPERARPEYRPTAHGEPMRPVNATVDDSSDVPF